MVSIPLALGRPGVLLTVLVVLLSFALGVWVFLDARRAGKEELAPFAAVVVGGLFLAGAIPGVVAYAVAADPAAQGFPTALRIVPGFVALGVYLYFRRRQ